MVLSGLDAVLVPYFRKWVFGPRFGAGNKDLGAQAEVNLTNYTYHLH